MKLSWQAMWAAYHARTLRERVLIAGTLLATTWALWFLIIGAYLFDHNAALDEDVARLEQSLRDQQVTLEALQRAEDPGLINRLEAQHERAETALNSQREDLEARLSAFVEPHEVPVLLEDVLAKHQGLQLVGVSAQAAEPLVTEPDPVEDNADPEAVDNQVKVYRHPVQIEFTGGYLDVLAYLSALEQGDWQFHWRALEYAVEEYPRARVRIEIETLSESPEWIGV